MLPFFEIHLPLQEPVQVFFVILLIILFAPLLLNRIKIPSIVGLILAGTLVGPHGLHLLQNTQTTLFGTVGLLYIMFLAGLEIDLNEFKKNRHKSLGFGAITFLIPLSMGTVVSLFILDYPLPSSLLLASMFSTHTLISYPLASRLGITKNEAVTVTVGGTIITDTAALLMLAVIVSSSEQPLTYTYWLRLMVSIVIFVWAILWGMPRIARWFFRNAEKEGVIQYIFTLLMMFTAAVLAEVAGLEPIIGAFLAGLALNRLIVRTSPLMNRVEFIGNALFLPFFLINVGMLVDVRVILQGPQALFVAGILTAVALGSKWFAAFITQKIYHFSVLQRNTIFGLSSAHAAATIAIILIAYNLNFLDENVLNGTIILIFVTCMVSSFVTDRAGRALALHESHQPPTPPEHKERILVPVANPANIEHLIDLAILFKKDQEVMPIYPLSVIIDDYKARDKILMRQKQFEKAVKHAAASSHVLQPITRVDLNATTGIIRAVKELMITKIIIGWNGKITTKERFFGSVLDNVLENTEQMVLVAKLLHPINTLKKIMVVAPPNAYAEAGFADWVATIKNICYHTVGKMSVYADQPTLAAIMQEMERNKPAVEMDIKEFKDWEDFLILAKEIHHHDLLILVNARQNTVSYHAYLEKIPAYLAKYFTQVSFIITYPEQNMLP